MSATGRRARKSAISTVIFLGGALIAAAAGSIPFVVVLLILTAITTAVCARAVADASHAGWTMTVAEPDGAVQAYDPGSWYVRHAAAYYHRRYVVPRTDLDEEDKLVWARAIAAANKIRESEVVKQRLIDSVQVAMALPERLWEIAEGLARLSEVRKRQRESLRLAEPDDPQIAAKVTRQHRKLTIAAGHIEKRVGKLEEFAGLLEKADAVKRKEATLVKLEKVDGLLLDLLATTGETPGDLDLTERMRLEVQAVIEQANEAARSLALPEADEDEDEPDA